MIEPLDPANLTPAASLNRMRIYNLQGVEMEPEAQGKLAFDLLGVEAIAALIRATSGLGLSEDDLAVSDQLPLLLDQALQSTDPQIAAVAEGLAAKLGQRLGYLVIALKRGDAQHRAARLDWDASYWRQWASIQRIWFGGGLMSGHLGSRMVYHASALLKTANMDEPALYQAQNARSLPLIGASRSVPEGFQAAIVFDFGGTAIKRALAFYENGTLLRLQRLDSLPSGIATLQNRLFEEQVALLSQAMIHTLASTWIEASATGLRLAPVFAISLAAYIKANQPLARQGGIYSELLTLSDNFGDWLAENLSRRLGQAVEAGLLHDGTAAARTFAGQENSAVIMLGTALGVGFPGSAAGLRPVAADLAVV